MCSTYLVVCATLFLIEYNAAAKEVIDSAKYLIGKVESNDIVIDYISSRLGISLDKAKDIFEKEVLVFEMENEKLCVKQ